MLFSVHNFFFTIYRTKSKFKFKTKRNVVVLMVTDSFLLSCSFLCVVLPLPPPKNGRKKNLNHLINNNGQLILEANQQRTKVTGTLNHSPCPHTPLAARSRAGGNLFYANTCCHFVYFATLFFAAFVSFFSLLSSPTKPIIWIPSIVLSQQVNFS